MIDLRANPFFLGEKEIQWVSETIQTMSLSEKIGQLFCLMGFSDDTYVLKNLTEQIGIGGVMYRAGEAEKTRYVHEFLQNHSKIPLLIAANLEAGGNGITTDGTNFAKPMQTGATNNEEMGYALGKISCSEGAAVGCNWAFAPIVDIDKNFRNPITNLRTFGDNADLVIKMASSYMKAADEEGVAVSIKHFPGDGVDERDQHLLTSINDLSCSDWDNTYGKIYRTLIEKGAKTVMVGHIALPEYVLSLCPDSKHAYMPATLSPEILNNLLREKLSFNGLIVTDASTMLGFVTKMPREKAVPTAIQAGCDMFLFTKDLKEDMTYMLDGVKKGYLTTARLDEAVTRILALKASLQLHTKQKNGTLVPQPQSLEILKCKKHIDWANQCADEAVTLVKDTQNLLPLSPDRYPRILLNVLEEEDELDTPLRTDFKNILEKEGFEVTVRKRLKPMSMKALMGSDDSKMVEDFFAEISESVEGFKSKYDLVFYVSNFETASNNTVVRIQWRGLLGFGNDFPWFVEEVPTLFISMANPYHLLDVPMVKTFINAYTYNEYVVSAVVEKIMGRSAFKGKSPVDASCGRLDTMQ
ncbi:MAG: glycoside hydrolase family 3 protein [Lachnospiraceae bacterium]